MGRKTTNHDRLTEVAELVKLRKTCAESNNCKDGIPPLHPRNVSKRSILKDSEVVSTVTGSFTRKLDWKIICCH